MSDIVTRVLERLPDPRAEAGGGMITVRLPADLHHTLLAEARSRETSLNKLSVYKLTVAQMVYAVMDDLEESTHDFPDGNSVEMRMITVRLSVTDHRALQQEARNRGASLNKLAIAKLLIRATALGDALSNMRVETCGGVVNNPEDI